MTVVKCYRRCIRRSENGICTKEQILLDTRGDCLYYENDNQKSALHTELEVNPNTGR